MHSSKPSVVGAAVDHTVGMVLGKGGVVGATLAVIPKSVVGVTLGGRMQP